MNGGQAITSLEKIEHHLDGQDFEEYMDTHILE
jgi:hypothetical protein